MEIAQDFFVALVKEAGLSSSAGPSLSMRSPSQVAARNSHRFSPHEKGTSAVAATKLLQQSRREDNAKSVGRNGTFTDRGGVTRYYSPENRGAAAEQVGRGYAPRAGMTTMNIDPRYGGGTAMGGRPLPKADPNQQLPTASGVPISRGEAYGSQNRGSGIYDPVNRELGAGAQAYQMDAQSARHYDTAQRISDSILGHYTGDNYPEPSAPVAPPETVPEVPTLPPQMPELKVPNTTTGPDQFTGLPPDPFQNPGIANVTTGPNQFTNLPQDPFQTNPNTRPNIQPLVDGPGGSSPQVAGLPQMFDRPPTIPPEFSDRFGKAMQDPQFAQMLMQVLTQMMGPQGANG